MLNTRPDYLTMDDVDVESICLKSVNYVKSLNINVYIKNLNLKIHKFVNGRIGGDDNFHASIIAELPTPSINIYDYAELYVYDNYLKEVFSYSSNDYRDDSRLSGWDMKADFEANYEVEYLKLAAELSYIHKSDLLRKYSREKHISTVFRIIMGFELARVKREFMKLVFRQFNFGYFI